jgi:ATP-dependent DNA helicase 2 subunit 2
MRRYLFTVSTVPKRVARPRKNDHKRAQNDDDEILLLDRVVPSVPSQTLSHSQQEAPDSQSQRQKSPAASAAAKRPIPRKGDDGSETEPESDVDVWLPSSKKSAKFPTPSPEPGIVTDPQRAPGRIIGMAAPLTDFRNNISQGDVVSKAVEDLGWVVKEVVLRPFAGRRHAEMIECLNELRDVCLQEDEIDAWNRYVSHLHYLISDFMDHWEQDPARVKEGVRRESREPRLLGRGEETRSRLRSDNRFRSSETWRQIKRPGFNSRGGEKLFWRRFTLLIPSSSGRANLMTVLASLVINN